MERVRAALLQGRLGVAHRPRRCSRADAAPPGGPLIISTGMSTMRGDRRRRRRRRPRRPARSRTRPRSYPCPVERPEPAHDRHAAGRCTPSCPIGYSGHETGLAPTWAAVALGATLRRAPHHARPRDVGHRPGGVGRDRRASCAWWPTSATSSARWATASSASTTSELAAAQQAAPRASSRRRRARDLSGAPTC